MGGYPLFLPVDVFRASKPAVRPDQGSAGLCRQCRDDSDATADRHVRDAQLSCGVEEVAVRTSCCRGNRPLDLKGCLYRAGQDDL